ncbi:MAG: hypothetical protein AB7J32_01550 [Pseudonocardia sp.]
MAPTDPLRSRAAALAAYRRALTRIPDPRAALLLDLLERRTTLHVGRVEPDPAADAAPPGAPNDDATAVLEGVAELLPGGRGTLLAAPLLVRGPDGPNRPGDPQQGGVDRNRA